MSTRRTPAKRRQRPKGLLPAGFQYRDGRPRWLPSPTRRAQGWKPCELAVKPARGPKVWLGEGAALERAKAINAAVEAWTLRSVPVPADMAAFAPPGAVDGSRPSPAQAADRRTIGAMQDAWLASPRFTLPRGQGGLAPSTIIDYRSKLNRLNTALVESDDAAKIAALRALPIDTLAAPEDENDDFPLADAYVWLVENVGHTMAHGVMSVASAFFTWCWEKRRIRSLSANPVKLIDRTTPAGAIRVGTQAEIATLLASADALELPSIGDTVLMAMDLGWSLNDLLRLPRRRIVKAVNPETGVEGWAIPRAVRGKTGVVSSDIFLMAIGSACVERILARHAAAAVVPLNLIVREASARNRSGQWTPRAFNDAWNAVRDHAALTCPSLKTGDGDPDSPHFGPFDFMDTRDTFITLAREAELTVEQVCNRSLHATSERVLAVWRKAYGATTARTAAAGSRKYGAHMEATGWLKALGVP